VNTRRHSWHCRFQWLPTLTPHTVRHWKGCCLQRYVGRCRSVCHVKRDLCPQQSQRGGTLTLTLQRIACCIPQTLPTTSTYRSLLECSRREANAVHVMSATARFGTPLAVVQARKVFVQTWGPSRRTDRTRTRKTTQLSTTATASCIAARLSARRRLHPDVAVQFKPTIESSHKPNAIQARTVQIYMYFNRTPELATSYTFGPASTTLSKRCFLAIPTTESPLTEQPPAPGAPGAASSRGRWPGGTTRGCTSPRAAAGRTCSRAPRTSRGSGRTASRDGRCRRRSQ
jgi:hypothetical protein